MKIKINRIFDSKKPYDIEFTNKKFIDYFKNTRDVGNLF